MHRFLCVGSSHSYLPAVIAARRPTIAPLAVASAATDLLGVTSATATVTAAKSQSSHSLPSLLSSSTTTTINTTTTPRRYQSSGTTGGGDNNNRDGEVLDSELEALFGGVAGGGGVGDPGDVWAQPNILAGDAPAAAAADDAAARIVRFERLNRAPSRFDILSFANCYLWHTTAKYTRKVHGPMREWSDEVKYRTGVHLQCEPAFPEKLAAQEYKSADDVEMNVYAFGTDKSLSHCTKLLEAMVTQEPAYVRLGIFRRVPSSSSSSQKGASSTSSNDNTTIEWLTLRRINSELRPPDIPPISLKLPGTYTLLFEQYKEAALRTAWEETGIHIDPTKVYPSGLLRDDNPAYYWRPPVRYFVAEMPSGRDAVEPRAPLPSPTAYMQSWDVRLLRQSGDPIDQAWAKYANNETGHAWLPTALLDDLQRPLRGDKYLTVRYTPPPYSNLQSVLNLPALDMTD